jgi:hypothetical protein
MASSRMGVLARILSERGNLVELLIVAVVIALGINLIASNLLLVFGVSAIMAMLLGIGLCFISISYLVARLFGRRSRLQNYEGFFYTIEQPMKSYLFQGMISQKGYHVI